MTKYSKKQKFWYYTFIAVCLVGCIWQVEKISEVYFNYSAVTAVSIGIEDFISAPSISACFRYVDILDLPFKRKNFRSKTEETSEAREIMYSISIQDIFDKSAKVDSIIDDCTFKRPGSYSIFDGECDKNFNVSKFFTLEYICYRIDYISSTKPFEYFKQANTPSDPGMLYELVLNKDLQLYKSAKFAAHPGGSYPYKGLSISPTIESDDPKPSRYYVNYFSLTQLRLPPPYYTQCMNYTRKNKDAGINSQTECRSKCGRKKTLDAVKKVPFASFEIFPVKEKHLSFLDISNSSMETDVLPAIDQACREECKYSDCAETIYFNRITDEPADQLTIKVSIPMEPSYTVEFKPLVSFAEYLTYVLSCFDTWFGCAVINLNPFLIFKLIKDHRAKKKEKKKQAAPLKRQGFSLNRKEGERKSSKNFIDNDSKRTIHSASNKQVSLKFNNNNRQAFNYLNEDDFTGLLRIIKRELQQVETVNVMLMQRLTQVSSLKQKKKKFLN